MLLGIHKVNILTKLLEIVQENYKNYDDHRV